MPSRFLLVVCLAAMLPASASWADSAPTKSKPESTKAAKSSTKAGDDTVFIRIRREKNGDPIAMETAIASYSGKNQEKADVQVDLVGVVHIGDKAYYEKLNKLFRKYDVVLYELVAPEGTRIPKGGRKGAGSHPLTMMQQGMKNMLDLDFQLEHVDYTRKNFVHADMTPKEFSDSMKARDESFLKMFFRVLGQSAAMQESGNSPSDVAMLMALFSKNRSLKLRRLMADQFENFDAMMIGINGPDGSTIITERNKKAFEVLNRELKAGKKKVAVFYGAGHLPDMHERLLQDFQLKRTGTKWLAAWPLADGKAASEDQPSKKRNEKTDKDKAAAS